MRLSVSIEYMNYSQSLQIKSKLASAENVLVLSDLKPDIDDLASGEDFKYCWVALDKDSLTAQDLTAVRLYSATLLRSVSGTKFGMLFIEIEDETPGQTNVEFRIKARTDIDVSGIAKNFGGGGHLRAGGAWFADKTLPQVLELVLASIDEL